MHQICVENGGIFPVPAGPAGTFCAFLAIVTQPLIAVGVAIAVMTAVLVTIFYI
jgi:hypothetical protein